MNDFAPPTGPPPPKAPEVPAGWAVRWNDQYKEWFYVNIYTKQSQWEKPTAPVFPIGEDAPAGPPPGYQPGDGPVPTDTKKNPYDDQRNQTVGGPSSTEEDDAKLAAKLQAEEDARARGGPGGPDVPAGYGGSNSPFPQNNSPFPQSNSPYPQQSGSPYPAELPPRERSKSGGGFLGKLLGKGKQMAGGHQSGSHGGGYGGGYQQQQQYYGQQPQGYPGQGPPMGYGAQPHYGQQGYGAPGGYGGYGGAPGYGGGYGGGHGGGFGGGHSGGRKPGGGGMGMLGGAALGAGAGILGGALIADAINDNEQDAYQDGFEDGADFGDDGGDFGD